MSNCKTNTDLFAYTNAKLDSLNPINKDGQEIVTQEEFRDHIYGNTYSSLKQSADILLDPNIKFGNTQIQELKRVLSRGISNLTDEAFKGPWTADINADNNDDIMKYLAEQFYYYNINASQGLDYDIKRKDLKELFSFIHQFYSSVNNNVDVFNSTVTGVATVNEAVIKREGESEIDVSPSAMQHLNESMSVELFQLIAEDKDDLAKVLLREDNYLEILQTAYGGPESSGKTVYSEVQEYLKLRLDQIAGVYKDTKDELKKRALIREHESIKKLIDQERDGQIILGAIGQKWQDIKISHLSYMTRMDFNVNLNAEELSQDVAKDENEVNTRDSLGITPAHAVNPVSRLSREVKVILQTLPDVSHWDNNAGYIFKQNRLGGSRLADFSRVQGTLYKSLANKETLQAKLQALHDLAAKDDTYAILLDRLNMVEGSLVEDLNPLQMQILLSLANSFNNANHKYHLMQVTPKGARNIMSANKEGEHNSVKRLWRENFTFAVQSSLGKVSKNQMVLNLDAPYAGKTLRKIMEGQYTYKDAVDMLAVMGIQFTNRTAVLDEIDKNPNAFLGNVSTIFSQILKKEGDIVNVFNLDLGGRFNKLIELELKTSDQLGTLSFQGIDGSKIYGVSLKGFNDVMSDLLFENHGIKDEMSKSPTTYKSKWFNGNEKIEIATLLGTVNTQDQFSSAVDKAGLADITAQEVSSILSGHVPFVKAGNKQTHTTLKVGEPNYAQTVDQFANTLIGYLEDEIVTAQMIKHGAASKIKGLSENGSRLQFFDHFDFRDLKPKTDLLINDSTTTRKDVVTFLKDSTVKSLMRAHILNEIVKIQKDLLNYNVLRKSKEGTYINIGIDSNQLQALRKSLKTKDSSTSSTKVTASLFKKIAEQIYMIRTESLHEQFKVLLGHPALYKDLFKRTSGLIGPKKYPVTDPGVLKYVKNTFPPKVNALRYRNHSIDEVRYVTRKEVTETSQYKSEYLKVLTALGASKELKDIVSDTYTDMEIFDGGGLVSLDFYRLVRRLTDSWTSVHETAYNNIIAGTATKEDVAKLDPLKPQVYAQALEDDIDIRIFNKFALFPIHPNLSKIVGEDNPRVMDSIHEDMIKNNLDYMVMESATKVGAKTKTDGEFETYLNEDGNYNALESQDSVQTYNLKFFGVQMDPKSKRSESVAMGTQSLAMLLTNVFNNGRLNPKYANTPFSETESWDEASQRFHNLNSTLIQRETQVLANKLGYSYNPNTNQFTQIDSSISKEMMRDTILEELARRDISRLMKDMIFDLFEGDVTLLNQIPEKSRLETIVNAIITNSVIRRKMNGDMVVIQSNFGFEVTNTAQKQKDASKEIQRLGKLRFYRKEKGANSNTLAMQVYLPHSFKEFFGEEVPTELIDLSDPRIKEHIGFRIPTEGLNSVEFMEVVGYLPQSAGSTVIVPSEMVAKSGADFDIDKLTLYIPNTRFVNGKMRLEPEIANPTELRYRDLNQYKNIIISLFDESAATQWIKDINALYRNKSTTEQILKAFKNHPSIIAKRSEIANLKEARRVATEKERKKITKQIDDIYYEINTQALHTPEKLFEGEFNKDTLVTVQNAINEKLLAVDQLLIEMGFNELPFEMRQTKEYLQNELQFFMKDVLRHPQSFDQLITPVGAHGFKNMAYEIDQLKNPENWVDGVEKTKSLIDTLSFSNIIETTRTMYQTLGGTGIVASSMTHAIKLQRAGVAFTKDHVFKFKNKPASPVASLSRVYSHEVKGREVRTINSEMQQYVTGYVDGEKDPFVMYVNAGKDAAAVHMVLLRIGIPLKDVLYFMSQPIITDFLRMKSLNQGVALRSMPFGGNYYMSDKDIVDELSSNKKYGKLKSNTDLTTELLAEHLPLKLESSDNSLKMTTAHKRIQRQILEDFLRYKEYAEELRKLQEIHSFDKIKLKNGSESVYLEALEQMVEEEGNFINTLGFENLVTKRVNDNGEVISSSMLTENRNSIYASNQLLGTLDLKNSNEYIRRFFVLKAKQLISQGLFKADIVYHLNKFDNFITANLIQSVEVKPGVTISDLRYELMQGPSSLPRRIKALQDSNEIDNIALYSILPMLDTYVQGAYEATSDNIKLRRGVLDTIDTDVIADEIRSLRETNPDIYQDLIYFSILQSGVDFNPNAYYTILPAEDILPITRSAFNNFMGNNPASELGRMWGLFLESNWDNNVITAQKWIGPNSRKANLLNKDYSKENLEGTTFPNIKQNSLTLTGTAGRSLHFVRANANENWIASPKKGIRNKSLEATDSKSMYLSNQVAQTQGVYKAGKDVSEKILTGGKILSLDSSKLLDGLYTLSDGSVIQITNLAYGNAASIKKDKNVQDFSQETDISDEQLALMLGYDNLNQMKKSKSYSPFLSKKKLYLSSIELVSPGTKTFAESESAEEAENSQSTNDLLDVIQSESEC